MKQIIKKELFNEREQNIVNWRCCNRNRFRSDWISSYMGLVRQGPTPIPMEAIPIAELKQGNNVYEIVSEASEARFILDEVLRGVDTTVVGTTNQVAGQLAFSSDNIYEAQVGPILINARTLTTDNNFRNNALRNDILFASQYEFITFEPDSFSEIEVDTAVSPGEGLSFTISGDLTIRDITNPVTFSVSARYAEAGDEVNGLATTTIRRSDFQLEIPAVPGVANVDDEVKLEFEFVAKAVE